MNNKVTVKITCTEKQAELIVKSLDLMSRLFMGQFWIITELFRNYCFKRETEYFTKNVKKADKLLHEVRNELIPELKNYNYHGSYGITADELNNVSKKTYWILKWIQHGIHKNDKGFAVNKDEPLNVIDDTKIEVEII